jgi:lipoprotein signal peptidase
MKILIERKRQIILSLGIFFINYFLDRFTKYIAVEFLKGNGSRSFFNNIFVLVYVENTGAWAEIGLFMQNMPCYLLSQYLYV